MLATIYQIFTERPFAEKPKRRTRYGVLLTTADDEVITDVAQFTTRKDAELAARLLRITLRELSEMEISND